MKFKVNKNDWRKTGVYSIINIVNSKKYIGSTTTNFRHRYLQYKSAFLRKSDNQPVLYRAFRKYGVENFVFEIIIICSKNECLKMEQLYIDKGTDYNACLIAGNLMGLKHSETSKTRTVVKGDHHSAVKVNMFSLDGVFIKSFASLVEAQEETNIKSKSNISCCCKGDVFSAGGYRWCYDGEKLYDRVKREKGTCKVALQKDSFYKEFHSQKECAEYLKNIGFINCNQGLVSATVKRNGFIYNYKIIRL